MASYPCLRLVFAVSSTITRAMLGLALLLALASHAKAQIAPAQNLTDLTLTNFLTEGWNQDWVRRTYPDGAPDMALLRVQTNFLARIFRTDFFSEQDVNSSKNRTIHLADALVDYSFNRRFMLAVTSNYEWISSRVNNNTNSPSVALGGRIQLVDVPGSAYALNFKLTSPAKEIGNDLTTFAYSLAGWEDLTPYGLNRVGFYFSVLGDNYIGPHSVGAKSFDTAYDVSLAKTWTTPTASLQNFTTFVELFAQTDLSGAASGKTVVMTTPGIRTGIGHHQSLMFGVDLPVSHPRQYNWGPRITYIVSF